MLTVLLIALVCVFQLASAAKKPISPVVVPKEFMTLASASNKAFLRSNGSGSDSYFMYSSYASTTCADGSVGMSGGLRFNTCFPSEGESMMYTSPSQDKLGLYFSVNQYTTSDCSGTPSVYDTKIPKICMQAGDGATSMFYYIVQSATPWTVFNRPGVVVQNFYSQDDCATGATSGDALMFEPLNQCFPVDSNDDTKSQFIPACANGKRTVNQYSDSACKDLISSYDYPLSKCSGYDIIYETDLCA